jgi:NAD(P)-dependent dehydrogenase (short-subunit alcohol dehydrogenase family)
VSAERGVALVTGAGRGIGRAIALSLGGDGWSVVINYQRNAASAVQTANEVIAAGGKTLVLQANVAVEDDRRRLVDETLAHFASIDLLVNNAGMAPRQRVDLLDVTEASYDEVMAVNLKGPFFLSQLVAQSMLARSAARVRRSIINIGSMSAYTSSISRAEYCISKSGLGMMTALFADRLAPHGINVYEVRPGIIATDMTGPAAQKYDRLISEGLTPFRRWGQPEDVSDAVRMLAAGHLAFSTGEVINVDGGFHLRRL